MLRGLLPDPPDFWVSYLAADTEKPKEKKLESRIILPKECYYCRDGEKNINYIPELSLGFCSDDCLFKYIKYPKPAVLAFQAYQYLNQILPTDKHNQALRDTQTINESNREGLFPVMFFEEDKLKITVSYPARTGPFPDILDDSKQYVYVWGYQSPSSDEADGSWVMVRPHGYTYRTKIQDGRCLLIDPLDEKIRYQFSAMIMNRAEV